VIKYIITVEFPNGGQVFTTSSYKERDGWVLFHDKYGNPKKFPKLKCFIEGVEQWTLLINTNQLKQN